MAYFNDSLIKIKVIDSADTLILKLQGSEAITITSKADNFFTFSTTGFSTGTYYFQMTKNSEIVATGKIEIIQNLATASLDYDARTDAEKTLDAIDCMLSGRALTQAQSIALDGKNITYSSRNELLAWREFYLEKIAKEKGLKIKTIEPIRIRRQF